MKKLTLLALFISACGSESSALKPTPVAVIETPTPTPTPEVESLVGNWIDSKLNTLQFNEDHSLLSNQQKLSWEAKQNQVILSQGPIEIDSCIYQIKSQGGLNIDLIITLKLLCDKAGSLSYTKND